MRARTLVLGLLCIALAWTWLRPAQPAPAPTSQAPRGMYAADGTYGGPTRDADKPLNLVLIVVDTLRDDCVGPRGKNAPDMPYLSRLAKEGARLTRVSTPAVWTYPSLASLLTGLAPLEHRVWQSQHAPFLPRGIVTFAEALSAGHGYQTAAFMDVVLPGGPVSMLQGFQERLNDLTLRGTREALGRWAGRRDETRPFFLLLHTYEAHAPYGAKNHPWPLRPAAPVPAARVPQLERITDAELVSAFDLDADMRNLLIDRYERRAMRRLVRYRGLGWSKHPDLELVARLERAYRAGVREVDQELEQTVDTLRALGLMQDTMLVITSDHGEAFGEHGVLTHGQSVHDELSQVPTVVVGPAPFTGGRELGTTMALQDLLPTFFELAGLPALPETEGRSMLGALQADAPGRPVLTYELFERGAEGRYAEALLISARIAREKYIITYDIAGGTIVEELFDLRTDPGALDDVLRASGRLGNEPVSEALAGAIESARDHIWESVSASTSFAQMGYGSGMGTIDATRPAPPTIKVEGRDR